jgi:hypothetical protein
MWHQTKSTSTSPVSACAKSSFAGHRLRRPTASVKAVVLKVMNRPNEVGQLVIRKTFFNFAREFH